MKRLKTLLCVTELRREKCRLIPVVCDILLDYPIQVGYQSYMPTPVG